MSNEKIFTVKEINNYIKYLIQNDVLLSHIYVKGEISNFKLHTSGHAYFTLKDADSRLKCVMFKGNASKLKFMPEDGSAVVVRGYFSIYERDGQYQLYAEDMIPEGTGSLYKAYEQLKKKLSALGYFDEAIKKKLPYMPQAVGVVTSPTGAAVRDIISIIKRRCSNVDIYLYPVQVQGLGAENEIAEGIRYFNAKANVDVMIIGRGGGSIEELWAFNEEEVAKAIFESNIPVISAVGHETDFTIADFTADVRAATPSSAAELAVPDKQSLMSKVNQYKYVLNTSIINFINSYKVRIEKISRDNVFRQLERKILNMNQTLNSLNKYLDYNMMNIIKNNRNDLDKTVGKLGILNPESALGRGYGIIMRKTDGKLLTSVKDFQLHETLEIKLKDGKAEAEVIGIEDLSL
ncbi:MAG TPA: exodeoxyribonuclease VII large subunit [Bacillota bacterium]|nr:exodeoxyribonuclease VII large subunit [Bacillota bacterium]HOR85614.1 exodeoxyribonuclease VII large subunit [Bacillota bacterium]HPL52772.1 exodeoxyribonuclease VII large subunit [Bacillota bacterium]